MKLVKVSSLATAAMLVALPAAAYAADITFKPSPNGKGGLVILEGDIEEGDAAKLRKIGAAQDPAGIVLSSDGGNLAEALEIGKVVGVGGYRTAVLNGDTCASSCALIWLAGSERLAQAGARIGFHAGYVLEDGKPIESGVANAMVGRYLTVLNLPASTVIFATSAKPTGMAWVDTSRPGAEGIEYKIMPTSGAASPARAKASRTTPSKPDADDSDDKNYRATFGKWFVYEWEDSVATATVQRGEGKGYLGLRCNFGSACRFVIGVGSDCEAGDVYKLSYTVEGYSPKSLTATCSLKGKDLTLSNIAAFNTDLSGETSITFTVDTDKGNENVVFPLVGYTEAVAAMVKEGYIKNGLGVAPADR